MVISLSCRLKPSHIDDACKIFLLCYSFGGAKQGLLQLISSLERIMFKRRLLKVNLTPLNWILNIAHHIKTKIEKYRRLRKLEAFLRNSVCCNRNISCWLFSDATCSNKKIILFSNFLVNWCLMSLCLVIGCWIGFLWRNSLHHYYL